MKQIIGLRPTFKKLKNDANFVEIENIHSLIFVHNLYTDNPDIIYVYRIWSMFAFSYLLIFLKASI